MKTLLSGMFWVVASVVFAQNPHTILDRYLTDEVVAVGYLDVSQIDTLSALEWAEKLDFGPLAEDRDEARKKLLALQEQLDHLADMGVRHLHVYVLFRVSDISFGGPTWVVPADSGSVALAALKHIKLPFLPKHLEVVEGAVLGASSTEQLEQLKANRPANKRDLAAAWKALGTGHCGLIVFGDNDSRRVVREMFPKLPAPFEAIDGPLIADRLLWGGFVANLPPEPSLQLILQTDGNSTAIAVQKTIASGFVIFQQLPQAQKNLSAKELTAVADSLTPQITEERLTISFENVFNDFDLISRLLTPEVKAARQAAQLNARLNQFKNIALAVHYYADRNNESFPANANYDDNGKPLLSWRVHILPYLEQGELYKQFHLDEPWDSKHNLALVKKMPNIYADPDSALRKVNTKGKTTYVVPTGEGTVFDRPIGSKFKDINDGTSNTIMFVEVVPESAVVWTKPADWEVDLDHPWEGVRRDDRDWFTTGFCDGHAKVFDFSLPAEKLRALLTRDGGEVIKWP